VFHHSLRTRAYRVTPKKEIDLALRLKDEYFNSKKGNYLACFCEFI